MVVVIRYMNGNAKITATMISFFVRDKAAALGTLIKYNGRQMIALV